MVVDPNGPIRRPGSASVASETRRDAGAIPRSTRGSGRARTGGRGHRSGGQRTLLALGAVASAVVLIVAGAMSYFNWRLGQINRVDLNLASAPAGGPQNYLLVGSDSRQGITANSPDAGAFLNDSQYQSNPTGGGSRSDTIMILRVDPAKKSAQLLSLPRDLYVPIAGTGQKDKVNAAFAIGVSTLIKTVAGRVRHLDQPLHRGRFRRLPEARERHGWRHPVLRQTHVGQPHRAEHLDGRVPRPERDAGAGVRPLALPLVQHPRREVRRHLVVAVPERCGDACQWLVPGRHLGSGEDQSPATADPHGHPPGRARGVPESRDPECDHEIRGRQPHGRLEPVHLRHDLAGESVPPFQSCRPGHLLVSRHALPFAHCRETFSYPTKRRRNRSSIISARIRRRRRVPSTCGCSTLRE